MEMYLEKVSNVYKDFINEVSLYIKETINKNKKEILYNNSNRASIQILSNCLNINDTINYKDHSLIYKLEETSGTLLVELLPLANSPVILKNIGFILEHSLYDNDRNQIVSDVVLSVDSISLKKTNAIDDITAEYIFTKEFNGIIARDSDGENGSNVYFTNTQTYSNFIHEPKDFKPINFLIFINTLAKEDFELASNIAFNFNELKETNKESIHLLYDMDLNDPDIEFLSFDINYFLKNKDIKLKKCYHNINKPI